MPLGMGRDSALPGTGNRFCIQAYFVIQSLNMKTTLQVKLLPSPEQHGLLLDTMHAFNAACTWIAEYAYKERCASKFVLQKALYQEIRQRFGLSAQLAIRAGVKRPDLVAPVKGQFAFSW